jgi:hypothetical protein
MSLTVFALTSYIFPTGTLRPFTLRKVLSRSKSAPLIRASKTGFKEYISAACSGFKTSLRRLQQRGAPFDIMGSI